MKKMLPLMAVMTDINDNLFDIETNGFCSSKSEAHQINKKEFDATMFDRPDIRAMNDRKSIDVSPKRNRRNSMPLISKTDFIEKWLFKHSDVTDNNKIMSDNDSLSLVVSESTDLKRTLRSPFRNFNEIKRFKNARDKSSDSIKCLIDMGSATRSKENQIVNRCSGQTEKICTYMTEGKTMNSSNKRLLSNFRRFPSNDCLLDFKFQMHKNLISSSPKKITKLSPTRGSRKILESTAHSFKSCKITPYESPVRQIINDIDCPSPDIIEVESVASSPLFDFKDECIEYESPKKLDIQSLPSSPQVIKVCIDTGSSDISDLGHDSTIDTDRNKTISQEVIDDSDPNLSISINNSECDAVPIFCAERQSISPVNSSASDETFFSHNDSLNQTIIERDTNILSSQTISQNFISSQSSDVKVDSIDQEISSRISQPLSTKVENLDSYPKIATVANKKKKKPKKGSLSGRLQALIVGQTSFLRIWRHQMTQKHLEKSNEQFIHLKIMNCTSIYNRQYLTGLVISDTHNLLDKIGTESCPPNKNDLHNSTNSMTKIITIITVPEIVGTINMKENSVLEIYQPWEVINAEKMILNVLYFRIIAKSKNNDSIATREDNNEKSDEIIEKFDCPCLAVGQLVDSCQIKFTNTKPNLVQYLFND